VFALLCGAGQTPQNDPKVPAGAFYSLDFGVAIQISRMEFPKYGGLKTQKNVLFRIDSLLSLSISYKDIAGFMLSEVAELIVN
jgi:hypothetical protein